jgi:hypothetical protein
MFFINAIQTRSWDEPGMVDGTAGAERGVTRRSMRCDNMKKALRGGSGYPQASALSYLPHAHIQPERET